VGGVGKVGMSVLSFRRGTVPLAAQNGSLASWGYSDVALCLLFRKDEERIDDFTPGSLPESGESS